MLVAGTNGKGSVCAIVESVCRAAGHPTVMLTNPHLRSYRERIVLDGRPIGEGAFAALAEEVLDAAATMAGDAGTPTQFELLTGMGILAAARAPSGVLVCEVGLGGRLDSTNVLDLGVAVVTNVSLEHEHLLGGTVELIAAEKAAVIKPGNGAVTAAAGAALEVIRERARRVGARLVVAGGDLPLSGRDLGRRGVGIRCGRHRVTLPLPGAHQVANAGCALAVCDLLAERGIALDEAAVRAGCAGVSWPGRMQWHAGAPPVLLDGAHNPAGMEAFVATAQPLGAGRRVVAVVAVMEDKRAGEMLSLLSRLTPTAVVTRAANPRSLPPERLAELWPGTAETAPDAAAALERAAQLAGERGLVVVCGSLYLVGDALAALDDAPVRPPR